MVDETEPKKSNKTIWLIIGLVVIAILITIAVLGKQQVAKDSTACCEKICTEFGQKCRGWNLDTLECSYSYDKYGYSWVNQVFTFIVDKDTKDKFCSTPAKNTKITFTGNITAEIGNTTNITG